MSKSMSPLKNAIQGLQIHKPFDLRGNQKPKFKLPDAEKPVNAPIQNEVSQIDYTQNDYPQNDYSQIEVPHFGVSETRENTPAPKSGFFMMNHSVFQSEKVRALSGDSFRLFIWMSATAWRFKDSNGELRASIGYASTGSGISRSSVSRAFSQLQRLGLVQLIRQDLKKGNLWRVSDLAAANRGDENQCIQNDYSQNEVPQNEQGLCSKWDRTSVKSGQHYIQNEVEYNKYNNINNSLRSARVCENETLRVYLENLKPEKKRESEIQSFEGLLRDFSESEIERSYLWVLKRGSLGDGSPVHSPMKYLGHTMEEVLAQANQDAQKTQLREKRRLELTAEKQKNEIELDRESEELKRIEERFNQAMPDPKTRESWFQAQAQKYPMLDPKGPVLKALALREWALFTQIDGFNAETLNSS